MIWLVMILVVALGLALGWFSYRYSSAFMDGAAWCVAVLGYPVARLGMFTAKSVGIGIHFPESQTNLQAAFAVAGPVAFDAALAFVMALGAGRALTHLYWRVWRGEMTVVERTESRAQTLAHYGFAAASDARQSSRGHGRGHGRGPIR